MFMNLKGILVGNGVTDFNIDVEPAMPRTYTGFHLIPESMAANWEANNCFISFRGAIPFKNHPICDIIYVKMESLVSGLNVYDMFRHVYPDSDMLSESNRMGEVVINGEIKRYKRGYTLKEYAPWYKKNVKSPILGAFMTDYVNRADVREAMNIPTDAPAWV